jgi:hypothetical protein
MGSADTPSQRQFDDLLADIIRTTHRHPIIDSVRELTALLRHDFPDAYGDRSFSGLRRDVTTAIAWTASRLYRLPLVVDDLRRGVPFDEAVATAQARPLHMSKHQLQEALRRLRELPDPNC